MVLFALATLRHELFKIQFILWYFIPLKFSLSVESLDDLSFREGGLTSDT